MLGFPGFPGFPLPVTTTVDDSLGQRTKIYPSLQDSAETAFVARGSPSHSIRKSFSFCETTAPDREEVRKAFALPTAMQGMSPRN